jgi:bifunctional UDP-N-acetylglucosamine pyrophosphorylase/glucosamine-1-phosphate N-acetyltransferase
VTPSREIVVIILAAGKGKRMKSELPKVLPQIAGKPIIRHVTDALDTSELARKVLVVGVGKEMVMQEFAGSDWQFAVQEQQLGTGHAVKIAWDYFADLDGDVLVILGDVPLLRRESVVKLIEQHRLSDAAVTVLSCKPDDPTGYGRIVRDDAGWVKRVVEHADATDEERRINEINTGIMIFKAEALRETLDRIGCDNAQGEYYLTDAFKLLLDEGKRSGAVVLDDYREGLGVNSLLQLDELRELFDKVKNVDN